MCGRYAVATPGQLALRFAVEQPAQLEPTYNAAPSERLPVIVEHGGQRSVELMQWGLIPHWAKDPRIGSQMINARAESVAEKPAYRRPLRRQRCLVPASGFYEWQASSEGKVPYYMHRKDEDLFVFAGLYDSWCDAEGQPVQTFTIITTQPNSLLAPIHTRMPAILSPDTEAVWLDATVQDVTRLTALLRPYPAAYLAARQVSRRVNSVKNNDASLLDAVASATMSDGSKYKEGLFQVNYVA
jgi:putative SOS response-associated peptidase YedK